MSRSGNNKKKSRGGKNRYAQLQQVEPPDPDVQEVEDGLQEEDRAGAGIDMEATPTE